MHLLIGNTIIIIIDCGGNIAIMDQERAKLFEMELNGEKIPEDYKYEPKVKDHHEEPQDGQDQEESHSDKVNSQEDNSEDHYDDPKEANRPHYKKEGFKDVFTVAFENGTRISLNEAQKKFRSTPK